MIEIIQEVDQLTDGLGMTIDPGIKKVVANFRTAGFNTTESC